MRPARVSDLRKVTEGFPDAEIAAETQRASSRCVQRRASPAAPSETASRQQPARGAGSQPDRIATHQILECRWFGVTLSALVGQPSGEKRQESTSRLHRVRHKVRLEHLSSEYELVPQDDGDQDGARTSQTRCNIIKHAHLRKPKRHEDSLRSENCSPTERRQ